MTRRSMDPAAFERLVDAVTDALVGAGADRIGTSPSPRNAAPNVAALIDHTILRPDAIQTDIDRLCDEAAEHRFASVCVNPVWVERCARRLSGTGVKTCSVVGFPLGATLSAIKAAETRMCIELGATEIDMVLAIGLLKSQRDDDVLRDIEAVTAARSAGVTVKVILETCLLTDDEKRRGCRMAVKAGADFVKTSTGFSTGGATVADIVLMRSEVGPHLGVKASGGVKDRATLERMVAAGATRVGASAGVKIVRGEG